MKNFILVVSLCSLLMSSSFVNSLEFASQLDGMKLMVDSGKVTNEKKEIILANIKYLESLVQNKRPQPMIALGQKELIRLIDPILRR